MTTLLLCNIGTRDIQWDKKVQFPDQALVLNEKEGFLQTTPRVTGKYIIDNWKLYEHLIKLPMIHKAIEHIQSEPSDLIIHLFASDQPESVPAYHRNSDTLFFADIAKQILKSKTYGLERKHQVIIHKTSSNPADYDLMYDFYKAEIARIKHDIEPLTHVYILLAGGTPAMNTMALLVGSDVFEAQCQPLYVSQDRPAIELDVNRQIAYRTLVRSLDDVLKTYGYSTALRLITSHQRIIPYDIYRLVTSLLEYADARYRFDWKTATAVLRPALSESRTLRPHLQQLAADITHPSDQQYLRETLFLAQVAAHIEDWGTFLARLHRFSEGSLQLLAETFGVQWSDKDRKSYKQAWWDANRSMLSKLALADEIKPTDKSENEKRQVNRENLVTIIRHSGSAHPATLMILEQLAIVGKPIGLRHRIVHDFKPTNKEEVEKTGATIEQLLAAIKQSYQLQFEQSIVGDNPYDITNHLCKQMLAGEK